MSNLTNIPKIKSPLEAFKESVDKATPEELQTKINDLNDQLDIYYKSGLEVPAAKSQIDTLQNKLEICFSKVSENSDKLSEKKVDLKGKGKEIDLKGKGKAK
jgi:predicted RNase H-like nuclease (RuvC/YqgF family)